MLRTFTVVAGISLTIISFLIPTQESCRCRPFEPCWPNEAEWATLDDSVDGNLLPLKPIGHVCHHPTLDNHACEDLKRLSLDSGWRAAQPASLQDWIWEGGKLQNESCHIFSGPESNCHQGRVPLYSVSVQSASHIQKAVLFAKKHNLRLVIKNTGHDGVGRSSGPSSFQIHTNKLKNLEFHEDFLVQGATESSGGPAVTIGAGVMQWEVYEKAAAKRLSLVGGECPTVGAVGGFLQGGGVSSFFSYARGLAIDNVLEYQVVTAEAKVVVANAHQNQDLFWALRGGGGGTFGIVAQATVRLFPDDPLTSTTISISSEKAKVDVYLLNTFDIVGLPSTRTKSSPNMHLMTSLPVTDIRRSKFETDIPKLVLDGLSKQPKTLPALLFYSSDGLVHWNRHSRGPDFYPRLEEMQILRNEAHNMASGIVKHSVIVDLGSASLDKVIFLLQALEAQEKEVTYYALDLSEEQLRHSMEEIPMQMFKYVRFGALYGTFEDGIHWLRDAPEVRDLPHYILLLGLTIGNFSRENAAAFLNQISTKALSNNPKNSSILITIDSCKIPTKILRAYTSDGVVPFALTALGYANHLIGQENESGPSFSPDEWNYLSEWNFILGRHEASLIPKGQDIRLGGSLRDIIVNKHEKVRFGCSYKYAEEEVKALFEAAGLGCVATWSRDNCDVAFFQLQPDTK
ncbi:4-dimethylallyltryptophan N-methyltransferase [Daldinia childiae]|uniref:4-dimethylallyltryptophan N-methyltransferase n=1 Tax=Daldinia childiae TaxID=326645 RepID=UPI001444D847|nr:4-dimethylallyltryptophan N-methyltransferase [Daldinia childiae]KAF3063823.1 4-dimethylallyltryptophan N-methyltransferase [Daldinia childiae]